ncbi:MAG: hypothetical protein KBC20_07450 [Oscillospiraceae bacterium]|nr:hypothetical protein [Oscillospiraceae bacterium]
MSDMQEAVRWEISVPIFKDTTILKQLGLAIGIPFGLVALAIVLVSGIRRDTLYALGLIAALLILTWLFIMVAYRGKYEAEFALDDKGVLCRTGAKQAKMRRIGNTLTVMLGLLSGKPAVAGAGMLAQSRQEVFLRWNHITKVKYKSQSHTILLRGGWTEQIALFCTQENYALVERFVLKRTSRTDEVSRK